MIALAALLLAASQPSAADAERAFAAAAQAGGQWAAFRAAAAPDAILYAPGLTSAQHFLATQTEPALKLSWRPAHTLTACDGTLAYSTGPWTHAARGTGSFGTIWRRDGEGWRWIYDNGHDGGASFGDALVEDHSACGTPPRGDIAHDDTLSAQPVAVLAGGALSGVIVASDGALPAALTLGTASAEGASADRTLRWRINPIAGGKTGAHLLRMWSWDGRRYRLAVFDYSDGR